MLQSVSDKIAAERNRQAKRWGQQDWIDPVWLMILLEEVGELNTNILERIYSRISADDIEVELVQVAAVAVAWLEALDRRRAGLAPEVPEKWPHGEPERAPGAKSD